MLKRFRAIPWRTPEAHACRNLLRGSRCIGTATQRGLAMADDDKKPVQQETPLTRPSEKPKVPDNFEFREGQLELERKRQQLEQARKGKYSFLIAMGFRGRAKAS